MKPLQKAQKNATKIFSAISSTLSPGPAQAGLSSADTQGKWGHRIFIQIPLESSILL